MKFGSVRLLLVSLSSTRSLVNSDPKHKYRILSRNNACVNVSAPHSWTAFDADQTKLAVWPLDEYYSTRYLVLVQQLRGTATGSVRGGEYSN
jgi:hypothetical protein